MKKSFLFKGVSVLGAVLLLANVVLPGINAYAYSDETWMWDYVRNEETWNNSATNGALQVYYANNPSEDLWCSSGKASFNDRVYSGVICSDSNCTDTEEVNFTTIWGENYQTVSGGGKTYYLTMDAEPGDTIYELYEQGQASCTYPNNISGAYFPNGWSGFDVCKYAVQFPTTTTGKCLNELPEDAPAGASIPSWALNLTGTSEANPDWPTWDGKCLYEAKATPQPTKYVKILSFSYPDCTPSYSGRIANGAKAPWISVVFKQEFKGIIKFNYSDYQSGAAVYPRGETIKNWGLTGKTWGEASIPEIFGNEYLVTGGVTTFGTDKFSATLIPARTLTIHYVYDNGGEAATDYTGLFLDGEEYNQASPEIANYTVDIATVTGTITEDVEITVTYTPTPSSNKSSGGGGGGSSKTTTTDDTKATTGDTAKVDENNTEENNEEKANDENKDEEKATPMTDAQAVKKFGQEQIDAYKWALENGITTMKTVEDARLDEPLTRAELAKMMVVYIQKVLEKDPVITGDVSYSDVDESLGDLYGYIKLAYQYQIMGINADGTPIEFFNPYGLVTRGEYATVFSRVLFGDKFNKAGEDFYTKHLEALKAAGVLTNTIPTIQEMRGWVMLMMYRSSQNAEKIENVANTTETNEEEKADEETATASDETKSEANEEEKAEEATNTEATTGDVAETPATQESSETTAENTETTAEATTGDVAEAPTAEASTGYTASN